jgi:hypothetical protein
MDVETGSMHFQEFQQAPETGKVQRMKSLHLQDPLEGSGFTLNLDFLSSDWENKHQVLVVVVAVMELNSGPPTC